MASLSRPRRPAKKPTFRSIRWALILNIIAECAIVIDSRQLGLSVFRNGAGERGGVSERKITRIIGFPEFLSAVIRDDPEIGTIRLAGCTLAQERDVVSVIIAFRDRKLAQGYEVLQAGHMITTTAPRLPAKQIFATLYAAEGGWQSSRPKGSRRS